jgi:hypothetical protein
MLDFQTYNAWKQETDGEDIFKRRKLIGYRQDRTSNDSSELQQTDWV